MSGNVAKQGRELAFQMLRNLPRVCLANLTYHPGSVKKVRIINFILINFKI